MTLLGEFHRDDVDDERTKLYEFTMVNYCRVLSVSHVECSNILGCELKCDDSEHR